MRRHSIVIRLGSADIAEIKVVEKDSQLSELQFADEYGCIEYGIGAMLGRLCCYGLHPKENAIDLAILAAAVTAADMRILRAKNSQDSWTGKSISICPS